MKVYLLEETPIGAGYFERVERLSEDHNDRKMWAMNGSNVMARRLREARHMGKNEGIGWCWSYGDSVIVVWRYVASNAKDHA